MPGAELSRRVEKVVEKQRRRSGPAPGGRSPMCAYSVDDRPDDEPVAHDEWHPTGGPWLELDACHTVGKRRRWYCHLAEDELLEDAREQRR
jgi:hypothetical protein